MTEKECHTNYNRWALYWLLSLNENPFGIIFRLYKWMLIPLTAVLWGFRMLSREAILFENIERDTDKRAPSEKMWEWLPQHLQFTNASATKQRKETLTMTKIERWNKSATKETEKQRETKDSSNEKEKRRKVDPTTPWLGPLAEVDEMLARCWAAFICDWRWAGGWKYLHESRVHLFFTKSIHTVTWFSPLSSVTFSVGCA